MREPAMPGCLISVVLDGAGIDREIDGLAQLGVQIIETDADSVALVRERSDLIVQVSGDRQGAQPDLVTVSAPVDLPPGVRPVYDGAGSPCLIRVNDAVGLIDRTRDLPAGSVFFASAAGTSALPVTLAALACGGHVRIVVADCPEYAPGEPTRNAVQLAARVVGLAKIAQRPPLSISEARQLLGVARG